MSFEQVPVQPAATGGPQVDPTDIVGRRVGAFLLDFLIVGVLSLIIGLAGFSNAFSTDSTEFDSADEAIEYCEEANAGSPDLVGGDPICIPADVEAVEISFDSSEGNVAILPIAHGALWLLQILLQAFTGATIGKFMTGIRVVREDGGRPGIVRSAVRTIAYFIDGFPWFPPMLLGLIASVTSKRHRRLGDRFAGTFVVNKAAAGYPVPDSHLFDVQLPPEQQTQHPLRDPVTGKLPPPAMPGRQVDTPPNDAVSAGAAAAARRRVAMPAPQPASPQVGAAPNAPQQPTVAGAQPPPPTPSPTGEFAGHRAGVAPTGQQPAVEAPTIEQPAVTQQPAVELPVVQQPAVEPPTVEQPAIEPPVAQQPAVTPQQPMAQQPAVTPQQPMAQQPAVTQQPAVAQQPAVTQPVATAQPAMPDGVMWDNARGAYVYSDGARFLQWDDFNNTWVPIG